VTLLKIILSDLQLPHHDRRAMSAVCNLLADRQNDIAELHQVGDFFDFAPVSRWVRGTAGEDGRLLQKEIDVASDVMADLSKAYPGCKTRIRGNHDDRLDAYLSTQARGLKGLAALDYDTLTLASDYGWVTKPEPYTLAPGTVSVHGLAVRKYSGHTAHAHLDRLPGNVVHGHTHRAGLVYRTLGEVQRWAMEVGCLMDKSKATYLACGVADWQLAIGALYVDGNQAWPTLLEFKSDRSVMFEGRRYRP
jgi:hypothetical protein